MTDPLRPPPIAPALRRIAARAGAAIAPNAARRRAPPTADHALIEGRAEPVMREDPAPGPETETRAAGAYRQAGLPPGPGPAPRAEGAFRLVRGPVDLTDGRMVAEFLPEILGRALARSWIDGGFRARLTADPKALLSDHDVHLPDTIRIETQAGSNGRPLVVVHEVTPDGGLRRLCYLQLVMVAGK